jgi:hypothetical protein
MSGSQLRARVTEADGTTRALGFEGQEARTLRALGWIEGAANENTDPAA